MFVKKLCLNLYVLFLQHHFNEKKNLWFFFSYFSFLKQSYFLGRAKKPLEKHKCEDRDVRLNCLYSHCHVISKILSMAPCLSLNCDVIFG